MTYPGRLKTRGSGNAQAKLSEHEVVMIRYLRAVHGLTYKHLAGLYDVSIKQIYRVVQRIDWRWV